MKKNKIYTVITTLFLVLSCFSQQQKSNIKTYLSNYQISESDGSIGQVPFKILIDNANFSSNNGSIKLIDLEQKITLLNLKIKYFKTTNDEVGVTYWFELYGNSKFNVLKLCNWSKAENIKGKNYKSIIVFSLYEGENRVSDLGMLCNKIK